MEKDKYLYTIVEVIKPPVKMRGITEYYTVNVKVISEVLKSMAVDEFFNTHIGEEENIKIRLNLDIETKIDVLYINDKRLYSLIMNGIIYDGKHKHHKIGHIYDAYNSKKLNVEKCNVTSYYMLAICM